MAAKLYPPYINGTIPAFAGTTLVVPFSMNKAVGKREVAGFSAIIKTVNSVIIDTIVSTDYSMTDCEVYFVVNEEDFNVGQYYKVQLAYIDSDENVGYYSTVGVVKYTEEPTVYIDGLVSDDYNMFNHDYVGVYSQQGKDTTEKLYSSYFVLKDSTKNVVLTSDVKLHKINDDDKNYEANEEFKIARDLEENSIYFLQFITTSTNGMIRKSPNYRIVQITSLDSYLKSALVPLSNFDDGYIDIILQSSEPETMLGTFVLSRERADEPGNWEYLKYYDLMNVKTTNFLYRDFTVEQGVEYIYSLQQYNTFDIMSNRIKSNPVIADFEDMFLFDGTRQLKVRYNPKMATYKRDLLETKVDTIGSKYPFITRNGYVDYKEFSLSGLISFKSDEAGLFMMDPVTEDIRTATSNDEAFVKDYSTTDLVGPNIYDERMFKNEVLDWLTNGKPKLLRTPTEGNYLVRLMNTSLSPNDVVGRMLHTFTSTAYEIDEHDLDSLSDNGIIDNSKNNGNQLKEVFKCVSLKDLTLEDNYGMYYRLNLLNTIDYLKVNNLTEEKYVNSWSELYLLNTKKEKFTDFLPADLPIYWLQHCKDGEAYNESNTYCCKNDDLVSYTKREYVSKRVFEKKETSFYKLLVDSAEDEYSGILGIGELGKMILGKKMAASIIEKNIESIRWPTISWYQRIDNTDYRTSTKKWNTIGWNRSSYTTNKILQYDITHMKIHNSNATNNKNSSVLNTNVLNAIVLNTGNSSTSEDSSNNKYYEKIYENDNLNYVDTNNVDTVHWYQRCLSTDAFQKDRDYYYAINSLVEALENQKEYERTSFLNNRGSLYLDDNAVSVAKDNVFKIMRLEDIFGKDNQHYLEALEEEPIKTDLLTILRTIKNKRNYYKKYYQFILVELKEELNYNVINETLKAKLNKTITNIIKDLYNTDPTNFYLTILKDEPRTNTHYYLFDPCKEDDEFQDPSWITVFNNKDMETVSFLRFSDLEPGTRFKVDDEYVMIGSTGIYEIQPDSVISTIKIAYSALQQRNGMVEIGYKTKSVPQSTMCLFDILSGIRLSASPVTQYIGENDDLFSDIKDVVTKILKTFFIRFYKRPIVIEDYNDTSLYDNYPLYQDSSTEKLFYIDEKGNKSSLFDYSDDIYNITINNSVISIMDTETYQLKTDLLDEKIKTGIGIITELSYLKEVRSYTFPDAVIEKAKIDPAEVLEQYEDIVDRHFADYGTDDQMISIEDMKLTYQKYLDALIKCLKIYHELYNADLEGVLDNES